MTERRTIAFDVHLRRSHLFALLILVPLIGLWIVLAGWGRRTYEYSAPVDLSKHQAATEKIDPNTASAASLQRLRNVGPVLAQRIVAYRQQRAVPAFRLADDLMRVAGVGRGTVRMNLDLLTFPTPSPQTQPATSAPSPR